MSWLEMPLQAVPFVVVDVETTGLVAGRDRVVEIAVVKVVLGQEPELLLDTLVDPGMPLRATAIHGLGDADVAGAPSFASLSGSLLSLLSNRVVAAHNAHFDWRFLGAQLAIEGAPPLLCTLELLAGLDQGRRYSLADACRRYEIELAAGHAAAADALATACLLERLLRHARQKGYRTLGDLAQLRPPLSSLGRAPLPAPALMVNALQLAIKARKATAKPAAEPSAHRRYLESVLAVVSDLEVDMAEVKRLRQERASLGLSEDAVRAIHARVFGAMIQRYVEEQVLDDQEAHNLRRLYLCLSALGWAPGEAPARAEMPAG
jgi:DNA polymerase-3 subunit epsilon